MIDLQTTVFRNFANPIGILPLHAVLTSVKSNKLETTINKIRLLVKQGKKKQADNLKKSLPAFTPSAVFSEKRKLDNLITYNPVICLDFDNVTEGVNSLRNKIDTLPTTFASFISPSGTGLKVFVLTNNTIENHLQAFNQVTQFYEQKTETVSDRSVKDIPRLCFLSYDPDLYLNINSSIFEVTSNEVILNKTASSSADYLETFANCVNIIEKTTNYINGNRNNFIFRLANVCKQYGIPLAHTLELCRERYDLEYSELSTIITNVFSKENGEFAKFAKFAALQNKNVKNDDFLTTTPSISDEDYALMPNIIKEGVNCFLNPRERDVFFTGALSILSACIPHMSGEYSRQTVYPNIFSFIIAPPASGKSTLNYSRLLGSVIQSKLLENYQISERNYKKELSLFKQKKNKGNNTSSVEVPRRPPLKVFNIPANSSYAKVISHLSDNGGSGVICETEADTMGYVFKQDWGSYSDMLRKAFHHESISYSRKTDNQYMEVTTPRLSVALTGTPGQIAGLISSADDGLFSRFLFYVYKTNPVWNDVSPQPNLPNIKETFSHLAMDIYHMTTLMERNESTFLLSDDQWIQLNKSFSDILSDVTTFNSNNAASIVKRLGLMLYRMAMIFTALRNYESGIQLKEMICSDQDFKLAMKLSKLYLQHSLIMFNSLPKEDSKMFFSQAPNKEAFFNSLPSSFTRAEAINHGSKHNLGIRSVDGLLKKLLESKLKKKGAGLYEKV